MRRGGEHSRDRIDDSWIQDVLDLEHASGERFGLIAVVDGYRPARDHCTPVVLVVDAVDGDRGLTGPRFEHRLMYAASVHPGAPEIGKRTRMDVDDASLEPLDHTRRNQAQVPGENEHLDVVGDQNALEVGAFVIVR